MCGNAIVSTSDNGRTLKPTDLPALNVWFEQQATRQLLNEFHSNPHLPQLVLIHFGRVFPPLHLMFHRIVCWNDHHRASDSLHATRGFIRTCSSVLDVQPQCSTSGRGCWSVDGLASRSNKGLHQFSASVTASEAAKAASERKLFRLRPLRLLKKPTKHSKTV